MLARIIVTIITAFCFTAGALAAEGTRLFVVAASTNWENFSRYLAETEKVKVEDGIPANMIATLAAQTAKERNLLGGASIEDVARRFLEYNKLEAGSLISVEEFRRRGSQGGEGYFLPAIAAATPAQAAVAAASAPTPAPVAVAQAPAPAVKSALPPNVVTEDRLSAAIKQQEVSTESLANTFYGVAKRQAKSVSEVKKAITALSNGNKEVEQKMLAKLTEETEARKAQLGAVNDHLSGAVTGVSTRVGLIEKYGYGIIAVLVLLIGAGIFLWFHIKAVKKEAIKVAKDGAEATLVAAQAAISAAETRAAATVRTVKATVAYAVEEAEHANARVAGLAKRVGDIEAAVDLKHFSFEDDDILALVHSLPIGGTTSFDFTVDEQPFTLQFERVDATMVKVIGIKDQRNAVKIDNLPARIKRAANKGVLIGISPVTDVIAIPMRKSA